MIKLRSTCTGLAALVLALYINQAYGTVDTIHQFKLGSKVIDRMEVVSSSANHRSYIDHVEADLLIPNSVMYLERRASLSTTNGKIVTRIQPIPSALLGVTDIKGFHQVNESFIAITTRHCVKFFSRSTALVSKTVGNCRRSGFSDGAQGLFKKPTKLVKDKRGSGDGVLVLDSGNDAIRSIKVMSGVVDTVLDGSLRGLANLKSMSFSEDGEDLYITHTDGKISRLNLKSGELEELISIATMKGSRLIANTGIISGGGANSDQTSISGDVPISILMEVLSDGNENTIKVKNNANDFSVEPGVRVVSNEMTFLQELVDIGNGTLLACDSGTDTLRLVDGSQVKTICTGVGGTVNREISESQDINNCEIDTPRSIAFVDGEPYIGAYRAIYKLTSTNTA